MAKSKDPVRAVEDDKVSKIIAKDPAIKAWADQLGITKNPRRRENIILSPRQNYHTKKAILHGVRPGLDEGSGELHWLGVSPVTQEPLKFRKHKAYRPVLQDLAPQKSAGDRVRGALRRLTKRGFK
jgi:hypothetical protein